MAKEDLYSLLEALWKDESGQRAWVFEEICRHEGVVPKSTSNLCTMTTRNPSFLKFLDMSTGGVNLLERIRVNLSEVPSLKRAIFSLLWFLRTPTGCRLKYIDITCTQNISRHLHQLLMASISRTGVRNLTLRGFPILPSPRPFALTRPIQFRFTLEHVFLQVEAAFDQRLLDYF
jgi:hypothetical protein